MADQEKEKSQELGLIDITEILSDYLYFPQNVGMGSDLHNSWSGTVVCTGETAVSAGLYGIGNIYGKYTERTAGRCGYGFCVFL